MGRMASLTELKTFCNEVRKAGGAKQIKDLMPSEPGNPNTCLIAKNLNFNCAVDCYLGGKFYRKERWGMNVEDPELAEKIGKKLGLKVDGEVVLLPIPIGRVAEAFDQVQEIFDSCGRPDGDQWALNDADLEQTDKNLLKKFWPYLDEQFKSRYRKPSFV